MNPFRIILSATKIVFQQTRIYWLLFIIFTILALAAFVLVPVWLVPGNNITFQLSLLTFGNWLLFIILALLIALLLTMQVFIFRQNRSLIVKVKNFDKATAGAVGVYAGILGGVFATASCSWCVAAVFWFFRDRNCVFYNPKSNLGSSYCYCYYAGFVIFCFSRYYSRLRRL